MDEGEIQRCAHPPPLTPPQIRGGFCKAGALMKVPTVVGESAAAITVENDLMEPL